MNKRADQLQQKSPPSYESVLESAVRAAMNRLQETDIDKLKAYLAEDGTDAKIDALIEDIPQVKNMPMERELCLAQNKSIAEWNLSQEPKLVEAKQRLIDTYENAMVVKREAEQLQNKLETISKQRSLDTTLALLQAASQSAEDEGEAVAEKFLNGELEAQQFFDQFHPKRCLAHARKVKAERLAEILRSQQFPGAQQKSSASSSSTNLPYSTSVTGPFRAAPPPPNNNNNNNNNQQFWQQQQSYKKSTNMPYPTL